MATRVKRPYSITMWDFSWLERRWAGAGYEDWDKVLDELADRGYDVVRIDAYPHLVAADPVGSWTLLPQWTQNTWGAQSVIEVHAIGPQLVDFIGRAKNRGIRVALSSWFRQDVDDTRRKIRTAGDHAAIWIDTLTRIEEAGLLDNIEYVDLCNEFPLRAWAPFVYPDEGVRDPGTGKLLPQDLDRSSPELTDWMASSIAAVRAAHPGPDYTYSFASQLRNWQRQDVSALDFLEPHLWMASDEVSDFNEAVGYDFNGFSPVGMDNVVRNARTLYRNNQDRYDSALFDGIADLVAWSQASGLGLVTTECWAIIDYKDWPGLDWTWVNDLNARAVEVASATGRWMGIATSNFTGPQFRGVWRDVQWHRRLTSIIRNGPLAADLTLPQHPGAAVPK